MGSDPLAIVLCMIYTVSTGKYYNYSERMVTHEKICG